MLKLGKIFFGKIRMCRLTEMSGASDSFDFDGKTVLVGGDDNKCCFGETIRTTFEYIIISRFKVIKFRAEKNF